MSGRKLAAFPAPHVRSADTTRRIMLDVLASLVPALAAGIAAFGARALAVCAVTTGCAVLFEWGYRALRHHPCAVGDLSAAVTGLLLGLCLPASLPLWQAAVGSLFAVVVVKQLFGGLGRNVFNPALAGRAFLFCWPLAMTRFPIPGVDGLSAATPLHEMAAGQLPSASLAKLFYGGVGGSIGETSALALLLGGVYLLARRVIDWRVPVCFVGTVAALTLVFPRGQAPFDWMLASVLSGGLLLGALFMATDYVSSPVLPRARVLYGVGCGALTVAIRYFGLYPEGVSYAILLMNAAAPLLDRLCAYPSFGKAGTAHE